MKIMKSVKIGLASLALGLLANTANSATDGALDPINSTGDFLITAVLGDLIRISSMDDMTLPAFTGVGNISNTEAFCVYRNGTGLYQATLTGSGAGNAFTITDGTNTMAYTVTYNATPVAAGGTVGPETGNTALTDCGGVNVANNATVGVTIAEAVLLASPAGTYTGTLTIVVAPL